MRRSILYLLTLLVCGWESAQRTEAQQSDSPAPASSVRGAAAPAQRQAAEHRPADPGRMEALLKAWEGQSAKLHSLHVTLYRIDKNTGWDEEDHFEGTAAFEKPGKAFLDFRKIKTKLAPDPKHPGKKALFPEIDPKTGKAISRPQETIICTGEEVWHYRYDAKQIFVYTLDKNQRKRALQEGPLPFLFDMRSDEAHRRYMMSLQDESDKFWFVMIVPRLEEDKEDFSKAWVILEKKYLLPSRIVLFSPDGESTKDFRVRDIKANTPLPDVMFKGKALPKPWTLERNPGAETAPSGPGRVPRARADQTARRPAAQGDRSPR